jgi:hypothetical protein
MIMVEIDRIMLRLEDLRLQGNARGPSKTLSFMQEDIHGNVNSGVALFSLDS